MSETLELAKDLVSRASVTPKDAGCQKLMRERLEAIGFRSESLAFGEVSNFWARRGDRSPLLVFAGHTDVVPPGPEELWTFLPFNPGEKDGELHGRARPSQGIPAVIAGDGNRVDVDTTGQAAVEGDLLQAVLPTLLEAGKIKKTQVYRLLYLVGKSAG